MWSRITSQDGLASDNVRDPAVAPDGTLWAATEHGVSHFDGSNWTTYTTEDGLASDNVEAVSIGPDGTVWAGTWSGLSRFDGQAWLRPSSLPGASETGIGVLFAAPDSTVWANLGSEGMQHLTADGKLIGEQAGTIEDVAATSGGDFWFATITGAYLRSGDTQIHYSIDDRRNRLLKDWFYSVAVGPDDTVWFATRAGMLRCKMATTSEAASETVISSQPLDLREFEVIVIELPPTPTR